MEEAEGGEEEQEERGHFLLLLFKSSYVTLTRRLPPEGKTGEKVGRGGKVSDSLGENVQQLRPGLPCALARPPRGPVLHTRVYILIVSTKPSLCMGPFTFKCLSLEITLRMFPRPCASCDVL